MPLGRGAYELVVTRKVGFVAGDQEGAARRAREGLAVSTGESSAAMPKPALGSDAATLPGVGGTPPRGNPNASAVPESNPSDAVTMPGSTPSPAGVSGSLSNPIFGHIGATIFREGDVLGGR